MKNIKRIYIISSLLSGCLLFTYGQNSYHDSVSIRIDDQMVVNMKIYEYKDLKENIRKDMTSLQELLKNKKDIPEKGSCLITYTPNKSLSITPMEPGERVLWESDENTFFHYKSQCNISSEKYLMQIQFSVPEELLSDSLINKLNEVIDSTYAMQGRVALTYHYVFKGSQLIYNEHLNKVHGQMDVINLMGGVGVNLIKNQPVIDFSAEVAFLFSKKGILKNQYYLSFNQLSDFSENSKVNSNTFLNIGYRHNSSNTVKNPDWLGVEFGYLIIKHGDMFKNNTFRFGFNWSVGKYITIAPQWYFSGNTTFPAIRIGFGL